MINNLISLYNFNACNLYYIKYLIHKFIKLKKLYKFIKLKKLHKFIKLKKLHKFIK